MLVLEMMFKHLATHWFMGDYSKTKPQTSIKTLWLQQRKEWVINNNPIHTLIPPYKAPYFNVGNLTIFDFTGIKFNGI